MNKRSDTGLLSARLLPGDLPLAARFGEVADLHVHFFGTATLSFADGLRTRPGDVFEITAAPFRYPLRNPLATAPDQPVTVRTLDNVVLHLRKLFEAQAGAPRHLHTVRGLGFRFDP